MVYARLFASPAGVNVLCIFYIPGPCKIRKTCYHLAVTISEIAQLSGYSRQRLNKLVDLGHCAGVRRKPSGRLEVFNEAEAMRWCEFLQRRKAARHQRNERRKEKRERLKVRRNLIAAQILLKKGVPRALPLVVKRLIEQDKFPVSIPYDESYDLARKSIEDILPITGFQRAAFCMKSRSESMMQVRGTLFDFVVSPQSMPEIHSYADIARHYGCTRAAISAMSKHLPPELRLRSGRMRRTKS